MTAWVLVACTAPPTGGLTDTNNDEETGDEDVPKHSKKNGITSKDTLDDGSAIRLSKIDPAQVNIGASAMLTITGSNFTQQAQVSVNGTPMTATVNNTTTISVTIPSTMTAAAGSLKVSVSVGQAVSNDLMLTVGAGGTAPGGGLTSIAPTSGTTGAGVVLTVRGAGFDSTSHVVFNGSDVPTTFVDASTVQGQVPAALVTGSSANVQVRRTGGLTAPLPFGITAPACAQTCAAFGMSAPGQCIDLNAGDPFEFLTGQDLVGCDANGCAHDGC